MSDQKTEHSIPVQEDLLKREEEQNSDPITVDERLDEVGQETHSDSSPDQRDDNTEVVELEDDLANQLADAQLEITKLKDSFLRAKAEQDNIRRRSEKEVSSSRKFAIEGFAKELLQVRDSLALAADVEVPNDGDESIKSIQEGVDITLKQLDGVFGKFALKEIAPSMGDKLDPNLHQAMSIVESDDVPSGHILTVIQVGFQLQERLLRPAMVVVAK